MELCPVAKSYLSNVLLVLSIILVLLCYFFLILGLVFFSVINYSLGDGFNSNITFNVDFSIDSHLLRDLVWIDVAIFLENLIFLGFSMNNRLDVETLNEIC